MTCALTRVSAQRALTVVDSKPKKIMALESDSIYLSSLFHGLCEVMIILSHFSNDSTIYTKNVVNFKRLLRTGTTINGSLKGRPACFC